MEANFCRVLMSLNHAMAVPPEKPYPTIFMIQIAQLWMRFSKETVVNPPRRNPVRIEFLVGTAVLIRRGVS